MTSGALASIAKSVISVSTVFNDKSVRLITVKMSPAVAVDEIENTWKYSGPLLGLFPF